MPEVEINIQYVQAKKTLDTLDFIEVCLKSVKFMSVNFFLFITPMSSIKGEWRFLIRILGSLQSPI
jgi:hypothetical protein